MMMCSWPSHRSGIAAGWQSALRFDGYVLRYTGRPVNLDDFAFHNIIAFMAGLVNESAGSQREATVSFFQIWTFH
jgi:hypothetical protein